MTVVGEGWRQLVSGYARSRLFSLEANAPLTVHLNRTQEDSNNETRQLMKELGGSYVVMVAGSGGYWHARRQIDAPPHNIESALEMKYTPTAIPSVTNLIVWDFWSIAYPLVCSLLEQPWKSVDVFAVSFNWNGNTKNEIRF